MRIFRFLFRLSNCLSERKYGAVYRDSWTGIDSCLNRGRWDYLPPFLQDADLASETLLRESLDIKWGHALEGISRHESGHMLKFKDKPELQSNFVVDCSGVHSPIRNILLPELPLEILAYVVFRGTRKLSKEEFKERYSKHFKAANVIQMKRSGTLLQIQINQYHKDSGAVDISYIYSRPAQEVPSLHHDEREINEAEKVVSDVFFEEVASYADAEAPFAETFALEKLKRERILHWLMRDVVVPLPDLLRLSSEGVVLCGDSVHAMPILGGQGANYAIKSAYDLGSTIAERGINGVKGHFKSKHSEWEVAVDQCERRLADMHHLVHPVLEY